MDKAPEGFQIISRHGNYGGWFRMLLHFISYVPPGMPDTFTIVVRELSTGTMHNITANDEREAMAKLRLLAGK